MKLLYDFNLHTNLVSRITVFFFFLTRRSQISLFLQSDSTLVVCVFFLFVNQNVRSGCDTIFLSFCQV